MIKDAFRKIRVGIIIDQLLPGGVQKAAIDEVLNFNKLGFETTLLVLMRKGFEKKNDYLTSGVKHQFLSDRYPKIFQKSFKLPFFKFLSTLHLFGPILAPIIFKAKQFDILISHGTTTSLTTWSLFKFRKIPYIAVIHDPMVYILEKVYTQTPLRYFFPVIKPIASFLEGLFVKAASTCLVDSSVHANFLLQSYKITPKIVYLGVNPPKNLPKRRGDKIIAFGRWDRGKNLNVLLDLALELPKTKMLIAGSWSSQEDLDWFKDLIGKKNLAERVKLITRYTDPQLRAICNQGRVWVHPHFEAFSLSALEAASLGLPIIIPQRSGITELFEEGKHGFFPAKVSGASLEALVKPLIDNERLAYKMGFSASKLVRKMYTPLSRARKLAELVEEITTTNMRLTTLELGHIGKEGIAGGDLLLEEMLKRLKFPLNLTVIIPESNINHWLKSGLKITLKTLPKSFFDQFTGPWGVFLTYISRIFKSNQILGNSPNQKLLYSSTGILPDVIPALLCKANNPQVFWLARIHHLSPAPHQRPGRWWVNIGSYYLQWVSLQAIKIRADLVIALNTGLKNQLLQLGLKADKIVVLGGGVDFKAISESRSRELGYSGVYLGRIHPAKGIFDLCLIWKEVIKVLPKARLAVIGPGQSEFIDMLKAQVRNFQLDKNIDILGFINQNRVRSILKGSRVFLFTDREAGWGLAVAEAMAAGLPVVGWDIGILGYVYKSGFLRAPLDNHLVFAQSIIKLLSNNNIHSKLSSQALKEASKYDWNKTSMKFGEILGNMI